MTTKVDIDPRVALLELTARADAERAYYQNRVLLLAQEAHALRGVIEAQKAEIVRLELELAEEPDSHELDED